MDGVRDTLCIKFTKNYSLQLQMKSFGPKKFQIPGTDQKVPFWQFFRKGQDGRNLLAKPSRIPQKFFLFWAPMNSKQCWNAKLEQAHFFRVQSGKITVCVAFFLKNVERDLQVCKCCKYVCNSNYTFSPLQGNWHTSLHEIKYIQSTTVECSCIRT